MLEMGRSENGLGGKEVSMRSVYEEAEDVGMGLGGACFDRVGKERVKEKCMVICLEGRTDARLMCNSVRHFARHLTLLVI
jgi:hypothetical protein